MTGQRANIEATLVAWVADAATRLRQDETNAKRCAGIVRRFVDHSGVSSPDQLRASTLMTWLADESRRKSAATVRNELSAIRQWSRFLHASGAIEHLPFESVKVARVIVDGGCDPLSDEQAEAIIKNSRSDLRAKHHARRLSAPYRLAAYMLMLDAGLRVGEVRHQEWKDVDWKRGVLRVTKDKARRKDLVPLSRDTLVALRLLKIVAFKADPNATLLMNRGGPNAKTMREDLNRAGCGIESGRFHRLRKHAITSRARTGWSVWRLTAFARHRDPKTTARYVKLSPDDLRMT